MKKQFMTCGALLALLSPAMPALAQSNQVVGAGVAIGSQTFDQETGGETGGDNYSFDGYYRYMTNDNYGFEAGVFGGTGGVVSVLSDVLTTEGDAKDMAYTGVRAVAYGQMHLSQSNLFYAKLGASVNRLTYTLQGPAGAGTDVRHSGVDFYGAAGWGYQFDNGLGINLEYQYVPVQKLTVKNVFFGLNYRF